MRRAVADPSTSLRTGRAGEIANAVWRGALGQDWVSEPCPFR
jgi:hypothetical protein